MKVMMLQGVAICFVEIAEILGHGNRLLDEDLGKDGDDRRRDTLECRDLSWMIPPSFVFDYSCTASACTYMFQLRFRHDMMSNQLSPEKGVRGVIVSQFWPRDQPPSQNVDYPREPFSKCPHACLRHLSFLHGLFPCPGLAVRGPVSAPLRVRRSRLPLPAASPLLCPTRLFSTRDGPRTNLISATMVRRLLPTISGRRSGTSTWQSWPRKSLPCRGPSTF